MLKYCIDGGNLKLQKEIIAKFTIKFILMIIKYIFGWRWSKSYKSVDKSSNKISERLIKS